METDSALSFELICLMEWLLNNGEQEIFKLVEFALKNGFDQELGNMGPEKYTQIAQDLPNIILDFLFNLEDALLDGFEAVDLDKESKEKLIPTVEHLDTHHIDHQTIWLSIQQTKSTLIKNDKANKDAKQVLFKKLLKNWEPQQDEPMN